MDCIPCDQLVPVTTAWRVLKLRMEERPPVGRVAANILNKQSQTTDKRWFSTLGLVHLLTTPQRKTVYFTNYSQTKPRTSTHTLVRPKQRKKDMIFGT